MHERRPFRHAAEALSFLFDPDRIVCGRSPAARLADKRLGEPGPLAGLDGAAEIGTAEMMLRGRIAPLQMAILACRYAPSRLRCECKSDCCSGWGKNPKWRDALDYVAHEVVYRASPRGEGLSVRFVTAVLEREYGKKKITLVDLGCDLGMSKGSCTGHKKRILDWLLHHPSGHLESDREEKRPQGQEVLAFAAAEDVLRGGGFIE